MWYFAYDHLSSWREMIRFYRHVPPRVVLPLSRRPAVLRNFRLTFPRFSEQLRSGMPSITESAGKSVAGVVYDLPRRAVEVLDQHYDCSSDRTGRQCGASRRIQVQVQPLRGNEPVIAITHRASSDHFDHYPPSSSYLDLLIEAACESGQSGLWIEHLRSFAGADEHCCIAG